MPGLALCPAFLPRVLALRPVQGVEGVEMGVAGDPDTPPGSRVGGFRAGTPRVRVGLEPPPPERVQGTILQPGTVWAEPVGVAEPATAPPRGQAPRPGRLPAGRAETPAGPPGRGRE